MLGCRLFFLLFFLSKNCPTGLRLSCFLYSTANKFFMSMSVNVVCELHCMNDQFFILQIFYIFIHCNLHNHCTTLGRVRLGISSDILYIFFTMCLPCTIGNGSFRSYSLSAWVISARLHRWVEAAQFSWVVSVHFILYNFNS